MNLKQHQALTELLSIICVALTIALVLSVYWLMQAEQTIDAQRAGYTQPKNQG